MSTVVKTLLVLLWLVFLAFIVVSLTLIKSYDTREIALSEPESYEVDGDVIRVSMEDVSIGLLADDYFDGSEAEALLQEAIATLPDVQRTVFLLRYFEEKKYSEISQMLDTSEGALKASYHIADKKISDYFKSHD